MSYDRSNAVVSGVFDPFVGLYVTFLFIFICFVFYRYLLGEVNSVSNCDVTLICMVF